MKHLFVLLLILFTIPQASAQSFFESFGASEEEKRQQALSGTINQYDPKYKPYDNPEIIAGGLLPGDGYHVSFARTADTPENYATLRFTQDVRLNGCAQINQPPITIKKRGSGLLITFSQANVSIDTSCEQNNQTSTADIKINRADVTSGRLKTLTLKGAKHKDTYDIYAEKHALHLAARASEEILTYWFYPDNLVILSAPGAESENNTSAAIKMLAAEQGFIPAENRIEGFTPPNSAPHTHYFIDPAKKLASILKPNAPQFIDTITVQEQFLGSEGAYELSRELDIFARKPGLYD